MNCCLAFSHIFKPQIVSFRKGWSSSIVIRQNRLNPYHSLDAFWTCVILSRNNMHAISTIKRSSSADEYHKITQIDIFFSSSVLFLLCRRFALFWFCLLDSVFVVGVAVVLIYVFITFAHANRHRVYHQKAMNSFS